MPELSGKQRRYLRALGHPLDAVVTIGKEGLTGAVSDAVDAALATHELIKVRIGKSAICDKKETAAELATATRSEVAQILGKVILLYRADPDEPKIKLPRRVG